MNLHLVGDKLRVVPLKLCPSCVTRTKTARKKWPREILGATDFTRPFCLTIFFRVTHYGLNERGTTRSPGWGIRSQFFPLGFWIFDSGDCASFITGVLFSCNFVVYLTASILFELCRVVRAAVYTSVHDLSCIAIPEYESQIQMTKLRIPSR